MYCKYCGNEIKKDEKFCTNCGKPVNGNKNIRKLIIIGIIIILIIVSVVLIIMLYNKKQNNEVQSNDTINNETTNTDNYNVENIIDTSSTNDNEIVDDNNFLEEICSKYPNESKWICTNGNDYWLLDALGEKNYFYDLESFEKALKLCSKDTSLYDLITNSGQYSDMYLDKMNSKYDTYYSLDIVDTETMSFRKAPEGFYYFFRSYGINTRYKSEGAGYNIEDYCILKQINNTTWTIEDTLDNWYIITLTVNENESITKIDVTINSEENERNIVKEIANGFRTPVSDGGRQYIFELNNYLKSYSYNVNIPIGVKNMIIRKERINNKLHLIIEPGFEEDYIELLKSISAEELE